MIGRILICLMIIGLWIRADAQQYPANQIIVQQPGDADYSIPANSSTVVTGALTTNRTWTLPAASAVVLGGTISIVDLNGVVSTPGNNIIVKAAGSDTINGSTTKQLSKKNGSIVLMSDHSSKWTVVSDATDVSPAANLMPITPTAAIPGPIKLMKLAVAPTDAPGAGSAYLYLVRGTTNNTCKLVVMVGTSTTQTNLSSDNLGAGC